MILECYKNLSIGQAQNKYQECKKNGLIYKTGSLEFTVDEIQEVFERGLYVSTYKKIYKCVKSERTKTGYKLECFYTSKIPLNQKGRFGLIDAETLKNMLS